MNQPTQEKGSWGGLWTANSAESFACNAVSMYTAERRGQAWQQQGFSLLRTLYARDARLQVVKVSRSHSCDMLSRPCPSIDIAALLDPASADHW